MNVNKTLLKAKSLVNKGELEAATQLFAAVLAAFPQNRQAAKGLASIEQARSKVAVGDPAVLQHELQNLLGLFNASHFPQSSGRGTKIGIELPRSTNGSQRIGRDLRTSSKL